MADHAKLIGIQLSSRDLKIDVNSASLGLIAKEYLECLKALNDRRDLLLQKISTAAYMELPLNYVLYETLSTSI